VVKRGLCNFEHRAIVAVEVVATPKGYYYFYFYSPPKRNLEIVCSTPLSKLG